ETEGAVNARLKHPAMGDLLVFDPTDPFTSLGDLPDPEQSAYGLLVRDNGGELVQLPLHQPLATRLVRAGSLKMHADGSLSGSLTGSGEESRLGRFAGDARVAYRRAEGTSQTKLLESFLGKSLGNFDLKRGSIENLGGTGILVLRYQFTAPYYCKSTGPMLLL